MVSVLMVDVRERNLERSHSFWSSKSRRRVFIHREEKDCLWLRFGENQVQLLTC